MHLDSCGRCSTAAIQHHNLLRSQSDSTGCGRDPGAVFDSTARDGHLGLLQAAALTGESEAAAFDRVLQAGVPAGLPTRSTLSSSSSASMVSIMDYNVSATGSSDISWALDLIGMQYPASTGGRAVLFPPGIYLIGPYPKLNETVRY